MSDEELRSLERAFAAAPGPMARAALVAALVRAGERRRAFGLLLEGRRAGEDEARRALEAWGPTGPVSVRASLGPLPRVEVVATAGYPIELGSVAGATDELVFLVGHDDGTGHVLALDLATLAVRWSVDAGPIARAALVGEDVVVVSRRRVRVLRAADGHVQGELLLPHEGRAIAAAGDRVVVLLCRPDRTRVGLACVLAEGPALAWTRELPGANDPLLVLDDRVIASRVCVRLEDGRPVAAPAEKPLEPEIVSMLHLPVTGHVVRASGVSVLGVKPDVRPELVATLGGAVAWRVELPAWARAKGGRVAIAAAGDEVLALVATEESVGLVVTDGVTRREAPTALRGRGLWDHHHPVRPALVVAGGAAIACVPAVQSGFVQVLRFGAGAAPPPRRGPLPGSPTPTLGTRETFELAASVWRTADGRAVVPPAAVAYDFLWGESPEVVAGPDGIALVVPRCPSVVLEPEPAETSVAVLVDLQRGDRVVLPLAGAFRSAVFTESGVVIAEGSYSTPGDFHGGGFEGCRVSGWTVPAGRPAFAIALGDARPDRLEPRPGGSIEVRVGVEGDRRDLDAEVRLLEPGVPGFGPRASSDLASGPRVTWPTPAAEGVVGSRTTRVVLAADLPERSLEARLGDLVATWDEVAVVVSGRRCEVARLTFPGDTCPTRVRSRSGAYVPAPPALLGLATDGAHVLAVVVPKDASPRAWTAVVWALDEPGAPLGKVVLAPEFLPPPRAILSAPPGYLKLALGRGVALVARHEGPLAGVAWGP